jgi:hypothetical protein
VRAIYGLGMAYLRTGAKEAAMEQYNTLKNLDADFAKELLEVITKSNP